MKKTLTIVTVFLLNAMLLLMSCQKGIDKSFIKSEETLSARNSHAKENDKKVYVSTIEELYAAINSTDNEGTDIVLAPGIYVLDASYPNGGRLELQNDMGLRGQPGQPDAVVIDESSLPAGSFRLSPTVSTGGIRVGRGKNSFEWLTIKGGALAVNPFSAIETDLIGTETHLTFSYVKIDCNGSRIGLMLRNRLDEHANRIVNAVIEHSEIWGAINTNGFGIAIQNRISGSQVNLDMKENYIHGNKIAILSFNGGLGNPIENCKVTIKSTRDRLEGNGCAIDPSGATSGSVATAANNNSFVLKMYGSTIKNNNPPGRPELLPTNGALPGGVYVAGGYNSLNNVSALNTVSNNKALLEFWGSDISNNNAPDFYAYGLWSVTNAVLAGTNNSVDIYLHGISANATTEGYNSNPADPAGTNVVNIYR
jgi:hypothetical protein